jgi:hypothetical protein
MFEQTFANGLRRRRPRPGDKWHLDEVFIFLYVTSTCSTYVQVRCAVVALWSDYHRRYAHRIRPASTKLDSIKPTSSDIAWLDAFRRADKHFTADNEPQAIRDWVDDMSFMHDDLGRWVHVAVDYQLSTSTSRSDLDAAAETVHQDLGRLKRTQARSSGVEKL